MEKAELLSLANFASSCFAPTSPQPSGPQIATIDEATTRTIITSTDKNDAEKLG